VRVCQWICVPSLNIQNETVHLFLICPAKLCVFVKYPKLHYCKRKYLIELEVNQKYFFFYVNQEPRLVCLANQFIYTNIMLVYLELGLCIMDYTDLTDIYTPCQMICMCTVGFLHWLIDSWLIHFYHSNVRTHSNLLCFIVLDKTIILQWQLHMKLPVKPFTSMKYCYFTVYHKYLNKDRTAHG
jgi:hypothetical protein